MRRFTNRNVLITGAASGIGYAVANRIASEGGNLALLDINGQILDDIVYELKNKHSVRIVHKQ